MATKVSYLQPGLGDGGAAIRWENVLECEGCGALVVDPNKHTAHHEVIDDLVDQVDHVASESGEALDRLDALDRR